MDADDDGAGQSDRSDGARVVWLAVAWFAAVAFFGMVVGPTW